MNATPETVAGFLLRHREGEVSERAFRFFAACVNRLLKDALQDGGQIEFADEFTLMSVAAEPCLCSRAGA
jgi:hypothetical protein